MKTPTIGTRVKVKVLEVEGTIISVDANDYFTVRLDNDEEGSGSYYINNEGIEKQGWWCHPDEIDEGEIIILQETSKHIAGLSPEEIDPDAYRVFMRDLQ